MTSTLCPCIYPDPDPETDLCACGHVVDEHDDSGQCQVPDEPTGDHHARLAAGTEGFRAPDANGPGYPCEGAEMGVCGGGPTHDEACPSSQGDAAGTDEI